MKTSKKFLSLLLVLTMIAALFGVTTANAATDDVELQVSKSGDTVSVSLMAKKDMTFGGVTISPYSFDEEAFTYTKGDFTSPISTAAEENVADHYIDISTGNKITVSAGSPILTLNFKATEAYDETKDYTFGMNVLECSDSSLAPHPWEGESLTATLKGEGETPAQPTAFDLTNIKIKKTVQGSDFDPITFTFNVTPLNGAPAMIDGNKITQKVTVAGDYEMPLSNFAEGTFTKGGTYQYTISEEKGSEKYWTYDETQYTLSVVVQEVAEGKYAPTDAFVKNAAGVKTVPTFTNKFNFIGTELTLTNVNVAPGVAADKEFSYVVEFAVPNKGVAIKADGVALVNNKYEGKLKGDQKVVFTDIPVDTTYTITETGVKYHTHTGSGDINETGDAAKHVGEGELKLTYTIKEAKEGGYAVKVENEFTPEISTLTVNKVVTGEPAFEKEFKFSITFTAAQGLENIKVKCGDEELTYGTAKEFTLKNGDEIEFTNIPVGATYVLTEEGNVNYTPSYKTGSNVTGSAESGAALTTGSIEIQPDANTITVTNAYSLDVPTGVTIHSEMIIILALVLVAMAGSFVLSRKLRRA